MARAGCSGPISFSTSRGRNTICSRCTTLTRAGGLSSVSVFVSSPAGRDHSFPSGSSSVCVSVWTSLPTGASSFCMAGPPFAGRQLRALNAQVGFVLDDPLDFLALFQFQGFGQRGGADQVELSGAIGTFDDLDFREIAHDGGL